jgi:hypothetical protein
MNTHTSRSIVRRKRATLCLRLVRETMGCQACGETDPIVLELHHVIPIGKDRTRNYQSLSILERDLALCTVVCANCHLRIGAKTISSPPAMGDKAKTFVDQFRIIRTYATGQKHPNIKLTIEQIESIRALYPTLSYSRLALQFAVSKNTIIHVVKHTGGYVT